MTPIDRFMSKVLPEPNTGCWLWAGSVTSEGYGAFCSEKITYRAHRFSYKEFIGQIPPDKEIDHRCYVRSCVNPDHLEAVSHTENIRRSIKNRKTSRGKTHCPQGHPYSGDNIITGYNARGGVLVPYDLCRTCCNRRCRDLQKKRREERNKKERRSLT